MKYLEESNKNLISLRTSLIAVVTLLSGGLVGLSLADNFSLAIGKRGQNARLASKLTHYKIDIKTTEQAREAGINFR